MTIEKTAAERLTAIHGALVDKLGAQPFVAPDVKIDSAGKVWISLYSAWDGGEYKFIARVCKNTIIGALDAAEKAVADMPTADITKKRAAMQKYGEGVDALKSAGFEADFVEPAAQVLQDISKNLLTHEATT